MFTCRSHPPGNLEPVVGAVHDVDRGPRSVIFVYERLLTPISPNLGLEFVLAIPPRIHAKATSSVAFLGDDVLSAKNVAPTLLLNYRFFGLDATIRPYIGAGVNDTHFSDIKSTLVPDVKMGDSVDVSYQL